MAILAYSDAQISWNNWCMFFARDDRRADWENWQEYLGASIGFSSTDYFPTKHGYKTSEEIVRRALMLTGSNYRAIIKAYLINKEKPHGI